MKFNVKKIHYICVETKHVFIISIKTKVQLISQFCSFYIEIHELLK